MSHLSDGGACAVRRTLRAMAAAFVEGGAIIAEEVSGEVAAREAPAAAGAVASGGGAAAPSLASAHPAALLAAALALLLLLALVYLAFVRPSSRRRPHRAMLLLGPSGAGKTSLLFRSGNRARACCGASAALCVASRNSAPQDDLIIPRGSAALGEGARRRQGRMLRSAAATPATCWPPADCLRHGVRRARRTARFGPCVAIDLSGARRDGARDSRAVNLQLTAFLGCFSVFWCALVLCCQAQVRRRGAQRDGDLDGGQRGGGAAGRR